MQSGGKGSAGSSSLLCRIHPKQRGYIVSTRGWATNTFLLPSHQHDTDLWLSFPLGNYMVAPPPNALFLLPMACSSYSPFCCCALHLLTVCSYPSPAVLPTGPHYLARCLRQLTPYGLLTNISSGWAGEGMKIGASLLIFALLLLV